MRKYFGYIVSAIVGAIVVLSITTVFGHNEDSLLARLKKLEMKLANVDITTKEQKPGKTREIMNVKMEDAGSLGLGSGAAQNLNIKTFGTEGGSPTILSFSGSHSQNAFALSAWKGYEGGGGGPSNLILQPPGHGNVGIGTTNPQDKLTIYQETGGGIRITSAGPRIRFDEINSNDKNWEIFHNRGNLYFLPQDDHFRKHSEHNKNTNVITFTQEGNIKLEKDSHKVFFGKNYIRWDGNNFEIVWDSGQEWEFRKDGTIWFYDGRSWQQK